MGIRGVGGVGVGRIGGEMSASGVEGCVSGVVVRDKVWLCAEGDS